MLKIILVSFFALVLSQAIGSLLRCINKQKFKLHYLWATGGMPSSHSTLVSATSSSIFLIEGFSSVFALSLVVAFVVIRDAVGVRKEVGLIAKILNGKSGKLNENAGHSLIEAIVGVALGIIISFLLFLL